MESVLSAQKARCGLGVGQEHPATPEFWQAALRDAGFTDVSFRPVVAEAGIVSGVRPRGLPAGVTMGSGRITGP